MTTQQLIDEMKEEFDKKFDKLFSGNQINNFPLPKDHPQYGVMVAYPQNEKIKDFISKWIQRTAEECEKEIKKYKEKAWKYDDLCK